MFKAAEVLLLKHIYYQMMDQWTSSDSGILRKTGLKQTHEDLLVFGYACKLFRDDEKALFIDQGKHLIPWLGDESLKIDRYDCRGALSDLRKYEAGKEDYDTMRWLGLSDKERHLEELCDKERYYSLEINEEEEEMYKDEEEKRQKMNAIPFSYDVPQNPEAVEGIPTVEAKEIEEVYVPPPILDVPVDIDIPKTVKENARIEKTALFVCRQGPQMEILIKAKQGDNPQFSFLNQNDKLYKFYRHVLLAFKNGRYKGYESLNEPNKEIEEAQEQEPTNVHLHSSLSANSRDANSLVEVPQVTYKPSEKCAYSQLVNRIQGAQDGVSDQPKAAVDESFARLTYEQQQQYYQYFYIQQYYEYYKQLALYQQGEGVDPGHFIPPADFQSLDPNIQNYIQQIAYNQYVQQHQLHQQQQLSNNSYAQIVSNVNRDLNPYTASVPQLPNILQKPTSNNTDKASVTDQDGVILKEDNKSQIVIKKSLLSIAADYGSDTGSDSEGSLDEENSVQSEENKNKDKDEKEVYKVPSGETQTVIDKMAAYVCKNGEQFEEIVKTKGDPRFDFLHSTHEFNKYYREKIKELKEENKRSELKEVNKETKQIKKEKKIIAPVSFSIKKPKEEQPKEIKSALPVEESDDEDSETATQIPTSLTVTPPSLVAVLMRYTENQNINKKPKEVDDSKEEDNCSETKEEENDNFNKKIGILDCDDPLLEMIELSGNDVKKESKRAEDKIKDKLAAAAREKLASISRDRALQQERKKKAAAFLKLKSEESSHNSGVEKVPVSPIDNDSVEIVLDFMAKSDHDKFKDRESTSRDIKERLGHKSTEYQKNKLNFEGKKVEHIKVRSRSRERERRHHAEYNVEHSKRKKDKDRKKSHKRKHSKHKSSRKAKKRQKKSESEDSNDSDSP